MTVYRVTGAANFRGHKPGHTFEAILDKAMEARALRRRNIEIVAQTKPALIPGSYRLPRLD